jgi:hypothetical protein
MAADPSREDKLRDAFLVIGSQYFAHARYSSEQFYLPVSATLFHHAIEMLLKGYLCHGKSSAELKKIGHNLSALWDLFKKEIGEPTLSSFDAAIRELDKVELLRYPDAIVDDGYLLDVSYGKPVAPIAFPGMDSVPKYSVDVADIDTIAAAVYKACEVSPVPYFRGAPSEFITSLPRELRFSSQG